MSKSFRSGWTAPARINSLALALVAALSLASCAPAEEPAPEPLPSRAPIELQIGVLIPVTGALESASPAMRAGIESAIADVNAAQVGITIAAEYRDAGDSTTDTGLTSATELIALGVDAIVGPLSGGVARKVIGPITSAGIVQVSPGTRSPDFARADDNGLFWRTAASCVLEGDALGAKAAEDGNTSVAIIHQTDFCGPELAASAAVAFERAGGKTVVPVTFGPDGNSLEAAVVEAIAAAPSAVIVLADQSRDSLAPLLASGVQGSQLYLSGLGASDLSADFPAGSLTRATTSALGASVTTEFAERLRETDPGLADVTFAAESYDAVIVLALAALAAGETRGEDLAAELQSVTGGIRGGTLCETFDACAELILAGEMADYDGPSGAISFDKTGDAAGATVRLFTFDSKNVSAPLTR